MRKIWGLLAVFLLAASAPAAADVAVDAANFPDEAFRTFIKEKFNKNDGDSLNDAEIAGVDSVDVSHKGIQSLKGIEHFTALQTLDCPYNQLASLDVSRNTELKTLHCEENGLTFLDLRGLDKLVPASVDVGGQTREGLTVSETGGTYVVDLNAFLSPDWFVNVKDLAGKAGSTDLTARYDSGSGKISFDAQPEKVTYRYDTGKDAYPMEVTLTELQARYTINVTVSGHGRITLQNSTKALSGDMTVSADSSVAFVVSADAGYEIESLTDNNVPVLGVLGDTSRTHTIRNVRRAHRLKAAFRAQSTLPVNPPASPDVSPASPDVPAPSPSGLVDIPSNANQWTIRWGARDAQGNVSVTVDVSIESENPLIAGSIRLEVFRIGEVRIALLPDGQEASGIPARAAAQKRAYTLRVTGSVAESARDTARIDAVHYKL